MVNDLNSILADPAPAPRIYENKTENFSQKAFAKGDKKLLKAAKDFYEFYKFHKFYELHEFHDFSMNSLWILSEFSLNYL